MSYNVNIQKMRKFLSKPVVPYIEMAGSIPEIVEERHIKFTMPVAGKHLNHVNTVYAGSMFVLMESAAGALFMCTYGMDKFIPILKKVEVRYMKPTNKDLVVEMRLTEEEAAAMIKPVEERGKGDFIVKVPLHDIDGTLVAEADVNLYAIPVTKDLIQEKK